MSWSVSKGICLVLAMTCLWAKAGEILFTPCGDVNRTPEVVAALEGPQEGLRLRFATGVYHFRTTGCRRMRLFPSNNRSGEKNVVFPLSARKNVTIDGNGATFVFHDGTFPFAIVGSEGVTIRNFRATTACLPYAPFEIVEKSQNGFRVRFSADAPSFRCQDGHLVFIREVGGQSSADVRFSVHALDRVMIRYLFVGDSRASKEDLPTTFMAVDAEDVSPDEVFFRYRAPSGHPKELKECPFPCHAPLAINLEQAREHMLFFSDASERVAIEDVTANRVAGMCLVAQMSGDVTVRGVRVVPVGDELVSTTADAFQFVNCYGRVLLEGCETAYTMDDALNVHGNYLVVEKAVGAVVFLRIGHFEQSGFFPFRPGDRVVFREPERRTVLGEAKVVSLGRPSVDMMRVKLVLDRELPAFPEGALIEAVSRYPDFHMTRCHVHDNLTMRLAGGGRIVLEGNRIGSGYCGLQINDLSRFWFESGPVSSVIVTNNVFENCASRDAFGSKFISVGVSGFKPGDSDVPLIHRGLVIKGNRFIGAKGDVFVGCGYADSQIDVCADGAVRVSDLNGSRK